MKIGLLNPWRNAAENQLVPILIEAALRLGHTAVECKNSLDILHHQPDFVLALSRSQPKLTDIPTYGVLFDPRAIVLSQPSYLANIFTYDGILTIFDSLQSLAADYAAASRRDIPVGYFYPTCLRFTWDDEIHFATARLAYFGVNWDDRRRPLLTRLGQRPWMDVYGPEFGWRFLTGSTYKGSVPFDGQSVLRQYRKAGVALCLFSDAHVADDIVTSRVFEAAAAGVVLIAPRMPWLEKNFGDAVLYFDRYSSDESVAEQIDEHMAWIHGYPSEAADLANRARTIFESRFDLQRLLPSVLEYHAAVQAGRAARRSGRRVSVIVRYDRSTPRLLARSIDSVARQTYTDTEIIVLFDSVQAQEDCRATIDACRATYGRSLTTFQQRQDRGRSPMGLDVCSGDFITILLSGDEWLADHLASLLTSLEEFGNRRLAYSGCIVERTRPFTIEGGGEEVRALAPFPFAYGSEDAIREARSIPISSIVFHRTLLDDWIVTHPGMCADDGSLLVLSLLEKETPVFTYRATCVRYEGARAPARPDPASPSTDDTPRMYLRFIGRSFPPLPRLVTFDSLRHAMWRAGLSSTSNARLIRWPDGTIEYALPASFQESIGPEESWMPVPLQVGPGDLVLSGDSAQASDGSPFPLVVQPPGVPWADGLYWRPQLSDDRPHVLRLRCRVERGTIAFGVIMREGHGIESRAIVAAQTGQVIVSLPIPQPLAVDGIAIQATADPAPGRVVIESAQLFAVDSRLPRAVTRSLLDENEQLRNGLEAAMRDHEHLSHELTRSRQRIREMRGARIWKLGTLYWRACERLRRPLSKRRDTPREPPSA